MTLRGVLGREKTEDSRNRATSLQPTLVGNTQTSDSLVIPFSGPLHFPPGISDSDQLLDTSSEVHLRVEMYVELPRDSALCSPPSF